MRISIIELNKHNNKVNNKFTLGDNINSIDKVLAIGSLHPITGDLIYINYKISDNSIADAWVYRDIMTNIRCISTDGTDVALLIEYENKIYCYMSNYQWYDMIGNKLIPIEYPDIFNESDIVGVKCAKNCNQRRGKQCILCERIIKTRQITLKLKDYNIFLGNGCDYTGFFIEIEYKNRYNKDKIDEQLNKLNAIKRRRDSE